MGRSPSALKKKKSSLPLYVKKFLNFAWLALGLYGISMMAGNLANSNLRQYQYQQRHDHRSDLRKTVMVDDHSSSIGLRARINQVLGGEVSSGENEENDDDSIIEVPSFHKQESPSKAAPVPSLRKQEPRSQAPEQKQEVTGAKSKTSTLQKQASTKGKPLKKKKVTASAETIKTIKATTDAPPFTGIANVLLVGAQKSGTTALASWIFKHGDVCQPRSPKNGKTMKEVHFFDGKDASPRGVDLYKKHFGHCKEEKTKIVLDATPDYLKHSDRVFKTYKELGAASSVRIVMILREPVDREYSWYNHMAEEIARNAEPRPYTKTILDNDLNLQRFEKYASDTILPDLESSYGAYSKWLSQWMKYFDRKQILVLSYDELKSDEKSVMYRLQQFLGLPAGPKVAPQEIVKLNERAKSRARDTPSCAAHAKLAKAFDPYNRELLKLLDEHPGPEAEQRPFPEFKFAHCRQTADEIQDARREEGAEKQRNSKSGVKTSKGMKSKDKWNSNVVTVHPATVFFATHHKTGTDISRSVASVLQEEGLVNYSSEWWNENDLFKDGEGNQVKCTGSTQKPEIRSYNQWPKWMIEMTWSKCVKGWWENWPSGDGAANDAFRTCLAKDVDSLKKQLKWASCDKEHLVVHFIRNPIDVMLSSYRYTRLGLEDWMREKVSSHPRFKPEYCGEHDCKDMTFHEAMQNLPVDVGIQLDMHLVSMENVKQMMVASVFAELDPEHHITVSLTDIMESSESFNKSWERILRGVFPKKSQHEIDGLVGKLKKFDMNADPDNFVGRSHSTVPLTSNAELEKHQSIVLADGAVKVMLKDTLVQSHM